MLAAQQAGRLAQPLDEVGCVRMKKITIKLGSVLLVLVVLGFIIDTGGVVPPDDALVYLNPSGTSYFPPTRTPANANYLPVSYAEAKRRGAKPDDPQGFNIDGPPLLISILELAGFIQDRPRYWLGTNTAVERVH